MPRKETTLTLNEVESLINNSNFRQERRLTDGFQGWIPILVAFVGGLISLGILYATFNSRLSHLEINDQNQDVLIAQNEDNIDLTQDTQAELRFTLQVIQDNIASINQILQDIGEKLE